jgi:hypothetical protein
VDLITAVGWLDAMDVSISVSGESDSGDRTCVVSLCLAATGFLPLNIPGSSLCNVFCCWVPFLSVEQSQRLDFFRDKLSVIHDIETEEKTCNF